MTVFALVDCNNFFVSCERIFRPDLEGRPVVVLSSNDGCVIARSNEAKVLGVPMGAPAFQYQQLFKESDIVQFSANFELYGDISKRITQILIAMTPQIEIYSVDESFLDLSGLAIANYQIWAQKLKNQILREVNVPVSIGIAENKTLAKLGAEIAKQESRHQGVYIFLDLSIEQRAALLDSVPIDKVWGIGRKLSPKLRAEGITTAKALSQLRPQYAQQLMGIHGRQLIAELQATSCYPLERGSESTKSIMRSRTFGEDSSELYVLEASVASLVAQAAFRARRAGLAARRIGLFLSTSRHKPGYRKWSQEIRLDMPTNDTGKIIELLTVVLGAMYQKQPCHRLGVYLFDLAPSDHLQTDLLGFTDAYRQVKAQARMAAVDNINKRFGKGSVYYATEALSRHWEPKHRLRSPRYVSDWQELPIARIYSKERLN